MDEPIKGFATISPPGSTGTHWLFPGVAEESMPVLLLTTRRCVSCGARIAPVTVLVGAAVRPRSQTLIGHRGVRPGARRTSHSVAGSKGPPLDGSVRVRSCVQHGCRRSRPFRVTGSKPTPGSGLRPPA